MLLVNVKRVKKDENHMFHPQYAILIQEGDKCYESELYSEVQIEPMLIGVVCQMLSFIELRQALPNDAKEIKGPLRNGIGLSDDHKQLIKIVNGKPEILMDDYRWMVANELKLYVGRKLMDKTFLKGLV